MKFWYLVLILTCSPIVSLDPTSTSPAIIESNASYLSRNPLLTASINYSANTPLIEPSQLIEDQLESVISESNFPNIADHTLKFAIEFDYTNDGILDYIFISNSTSDVRDLHIFDGITNNLVKTFSSVIDKRFEFSNRVEFINISDQPIPELLFFFNGILVNDLCNVIILDINIDQVYNPIPDSDLGTACQDYQIVVDWDDDGYEELLFIKNGGDYFMNELDTPAIRPLTGNLKPNGLASFSSLKLGNFTEDNIIDFVLTIPNESNIYLVNGNSYEIINNITIPHTNFNIEVLNIDQQGFDELIIVSGSTGSLTALNSTTGALLPYNQFQTGYNYELSSVIPDITNDNVDDLILFNENGLIIILSGANGDIWLNSPILNKIQNGIVQRSTISIAKITNQMKFVISSNAYSALIRVSRTNSSIQNLYEITWSGVLTQNILQFDSTHIDIRSQVLLFNQDIDKDGLNGFDEFFLGTSDVLKDTELDGLEDKLEVHLNLNPLSSDSDGDLMDDKYEYDEKLDWDTADGDLDYDDDDLENYLEYIYGTQPLNPDTDGDTCNDGYEIKYGTNVTLPEFFVDYDNDTVDNPVECRFLTDPWNPDTDGDGIWDAYEIKYYPNLDPNDANDANLDLDGDELTNLQEFQANTNPLEYDTDGDEMDDGYEVRNGLDPNVNDADKDKDKDLINNLEEYERGLNANGRYDRYISWVLIIILSSLLTYTIYMYRKLDTDAKSRGFRNYLHFRQIKQRGFNSLGDYDNANNNGFRTSEAKVLLNSYGFENVTNLIKHWDQMYTTIHYFVIDEEINTQLMNFKNAKNITEFESSLESSRIIANRLNTNIQTVKQVFSEVESIQDLITRAKFYPFIGLSEDQISSYKMRFSKLIKDINEMDHDYKANVVRLQDWFKPWPVLLSLIQMSGDRSKIELKEISRILGINQTHSKELSKTIIEDNPLIGSYSDVSNQFTKGTNVDGYIKFVKDRITDEDEK